ncbi:sensor domain-containing diguanylate cyclase [Pelomonas sp. KK5]|uniref:sensor domain-containing diguanylate cyclase n=1 Tax=Pelomonas sp. KK5 TaxID=1855730 RepID=UPI001301D81E|nr:sensor domain-containing diguanylate cyclase [Pelomonas sp. KK5]
MDRNAMNPAAPHRRLLTESRLFAMINASGDCFWELDVDRRFVYISENLARMLGYGAEELVGRSVLEVLTPEYKLEVMRLAMQRGDPKAASAGAMRHEGAFVRKDGSTTWGDTVSVPVFDDAGAHLGYFGITRDITQRKHDEQALREANAQLQAQVQRINQLHEQVREQTIRDELTGVYNRRHFVAVAERELARARRAQQPLSLVMLDVDHFKRVNDDYGHPAGDEALRVIGLLLRSTSRAEDLACRLGGEEFAVLMPGMDHPGAVARAQEWRAALASLKTRFAGVDLSLTASFGVATYPQHADTLDALMSSVDKRLYRAKEAGRNQVIGAE